MDKAIAFLADAKERVFEEIRTGFTMAEIPELAEMLRDIDAIEGCIRKHEMRDGDNPGDMSEPDWLLLRIESELQAAQTYCDKWLETKEPTYKQMAREEMRHSEQLINLARQKPDEIDSAKMQELMTWHGSLAAKLQ